MGNPDKDHRKLVRLYRYPTSEGVSMLAEKSLERSI